MTSVQYNGHFTAIYPDHLDASTGKTLVAVPGQSYTVTVAPGRNSGLPSLPNDGRWGASGWAAARPREDIQLPPSPDGAGGSKTIPAAPEGAASPESEE